MIVKNGATRYARAKISTREIIIGKLNTRVNIFTWILQFKLKFEKGERNVTDLKEVE